MSINYAVTISINYTTVTNHDDRQLIRSLHNTKCFFSSTMNYDRLRSLFASNTNSFSTVSSSTS